MIRPFQLMACFLLSSACFAGGHLAEIPLEWNQKVEDDSFRIEGSVMEKYTAAAKLFSKTAQRSNNTVETNLVTYETTYLGVYCHVGWYSDGYIGTSLDGTEPGKQIVILNNMVVGISYDMEVKNDHFVHRYTWGAVYSYPNRQVLVVY